MLLFTFSPCLGKCLLFPLTLILTLHLTCQSELCASKSPQTPLQALLLNGTSPLPQSLPQHSFTDSSFSANVLCKHWVCFMQRRSFKSLPWTTFLAHGFSSQGHLLQCSRHHICMQTIERRVEVNISRLHQSFQ